MWGGGRQPLTRMGVEILYMESPVRCELSLHATPLHPSVLQKNRVRNGELYRCIADTGGAFVQPALYEGAQSCTAHCLHTSLDCSL